MATLANIAYVNGQKIGQNKKEKFLRYAKVKKSPEAIFNSPLGQYRCKNLNRAPNLKRTQVVGCMQ